MLPASRCYLENWLSRCSSSPNSSGIKCGAVKTKGTCGPAIWGRVAGLPRNSLTNYQPSSMTCFLMDCLFGSQAAARKNTRYVLKCVGRYMKFCARGNFPIRCTEFYPVISASNLCGILILFADIVVNGNADQVIQLEVSADLGSV